MTPNTFQVHRSVNSGRRTKRANWDCVKKADGNWSVHFWADHVPSEDFVATDEELFDMIKVQHNGWIEKMKEHQSCNTHTNADKQPLENY